MSQIELLMQELDLNTEMIKTTMRKIDVICSKRNVTDHTASKRSLTLYGNGDGNGDGSY